METRISFHPIKKILLVSSDFEAHSETIAKRGRKLPFDQWIRGIIKENKLYLRLYYPLNDLEEKSLVELKEASFHLLFDAKIDLLKALKDEGIAKPSKLVYNVTNDNLKGILTNI